MVDKEKKEEEIAKPDILFEETFSSIKEDIRISLQTFVIFLFIAFIARFIFKVNIPFFVFFALFIWILLYSFYNYLVKSKKTREELCNFHFRNVSLDAFLLTIVIHYLGGAEWIGVILYVLILTWSGIVLPKKQTYLLSGLCISFYSILVLLEYFRFLPHHSTFGPSSGSYQNPAYVLINILVSAGVLFYVSDTCGTFSETLRKTQKELMKSQEEVEEAKKVLEIKVMARTKELRELAESLDEQVKERTKELQEKINELEKFSKLAVGRELKMVQLKEEIKRLREELKAKQ